MIEAFGGEREAVLAREITKTFETIRRGPLAALAQFVSADSNQQKGEIVLIVAGKPRGEQDISSEVSTWLLRLAQELPAKQAAAVVADCTGSAQKPALRATARAEARAGRLSVYLVDSHLGRL
jgi:16S rRNA (cytidine1402-2'-O)-methyltransferase